MTAFPPLPLGSRIPNRPHAVSVSIPTMSDLRGYEEKDPVILRQMPSGYPRFVVHPLIRTLADELSRSLGLGGRKLWLVTSEKMARALLAYVGDDSARIVESGGVYGVSHAESAEFAARAKSFLQHTGGFLSSRQAEDELVRLGCRSAADAEESVRQAADEVLWGSLSPLLGGAQRKDVHFTSSGINAVYSAFRAVSQVQAARGRRLWVQLGWLYLDTIAIMRKFSASPGDYRMVRQVDDHAALEKLMVEEGHTVAGIMAEVPTNPLIQTPDLPWLSSLARRHGARLVLDPSVASLYAVDLFPYADLLVTSLTKYTAYEGDVIAGLVAVNPTGPDAEALRAALPAAVEPLYSRDCARLAAQVERAPAVFSMIEERLGVVARYLESKPEVAKVHWSRTPRTAGAFETLARSVDSVGGMLSIELKVPLEPFYDALRLPKGPSFGMHCSLACPFIWLGHYDLVTTPEGRAELAASGINPNLLRLSIGTEAAGDIIDALEEAFRIAACI